MKVTIFHNVQRNCRTCDVPLNSLGNDRYEYAAPPPAEAPPHAASPYHAGFDGYQPGHAMVRVFETEVAGGEDPFKVAERMFEAFNIGNEYPDHPDYDLACQYRARRLRSLSVGDVVAVGEAPLVVGRIGWKPAEGKFNEVQEGDYGSVPLPRS
jgi:hypothetical protein